MTNEVPPPINQSQEQLVDQMGEYLFSRFMEVVEKEDVETSKAIMDEWIVDGQDPEDGGVEFIFFKA